MDDDEKFAEQVRIGHHFAVMAGDRLQAAGIQVKVTPLEIRTHVEDRYRFCDEFDMVANGKRVEVKSRGFAFSGPHDFPYPTAYFYPVHTWAKKTSLPAAIVLIAQKPPHGIAVVPLTTRPHWQQVRVYDSMRRQHNLSYAVDIRRLRPEGELVTYLQQFAVFEKAPEFITADLMRWGFSE